MIALQLIRRNQRLMLEHRKRRALLRSGRSHVYNGRIDITQATAEMQTRHIRELLKANRVLRQHC